MSLEHTVSGVHRPYQPRCGWCAGNACAEEAGLVITDADGRQHTHWNLRGRIVFPYIADGQVVDLRTRTYQGQKGYRSLGPYEPRGAVAPFGWDSIAPGTKTVIITEAEFKALAALQAYHADDLAYPTLGQPGLTVFRPEWARELVARGVEEIVLCYDSQPRSCKDGLSALTPEEQWSLRHGATCAAAGLQVRVARLPLAPGEDKVEIDTFIPRYGVARFQQLIATAPLLIDYHRAIGCTLLERHNLPLPSSYPTRRERPTRLTMSETAALYEEAPTKAACSTLAEARTQIATLAEQHATRAKASWCWPIRLVPGRASIRPSGSNSGCRRLQLVMMGVAFWSGPRSARRNGTTRRALI